MALAEWARELARSLLEEPLPRRWAHTQGVARQARTLAPILGDDADLLEGAAWLHDIGYSPALVVTGFHPLDGARYLRDVKHVDDRLCRLVAHHSCAIYEAEERGLASELAFEFRPMIGHLVNALIYCDMTIAPTGEPTHVSERIRDIEQRYGRSHVVTRSIIRASSVLKSATWSILKDLSAKGHRP